MDIGFNFLKKLFYLDTKKKVRKFLFVFKCAIKQPAFLILLNLIVWPTGNDNKIAKIILKRRFFYILIATCTSKNSLTVFLI